MNRSPLLEEFESCCSCNRPFGTSLAEHYTPDPFLICRNEHCVCRNCLPQIIRCPLCRTPVTGEYPRASRFAQLCNNMILQIEEYRQKSGYVKEEIDAIVDARLKISREHQQTLAELHMTQQRLVTVEMEIGATLRETERLQRKLDEKDEVILNLLKREGQRM